MSLIVKDKSNISNNDNVKCVWYELTYMDQNQILNEPELKNITMPLKSTNVLTTEQYKIKLRNQTYIPHKTVYSNRNEIYNWFIKRCDNDKYKTGTITKLFNTSPNNGYTYYDIDLHNHVFIEVTVNTTEKVYVFLTPTDSILQQKIIWLYRTHPYLWTFGKTISNPIHVYLSPVACILK